MSEYKKIKSKQAEQLGNVDDLHPIKQVTVMSAVQILMLIGMGAMMLLISNMV